MTQKIPKANMRALSLFSTLDFEGTLGALEHHEDRILARPVWFLPLPCQCSQASPRARPHLSCWRCKCLHGMVACPRLHRLTWSGRVCYCRPRGRTRAQVHMHCTESPRIRRHAWTQKPCTPTRSRPSGSAPGPLEHSTGTQRWMNWSSHLQHKLM